MKKENICPGCGRHCDLNHPHCKYGRSYAEKLQKKREKAPSYKWEDYTEKGDLAWLLFLVSRNWKKALKKGETTEEKLLAAWTEQEKETLREMLGKMLEYR